MTKNLQTFYGNRWSTSVNKALKSKVREKSILDFSTDLITYQSFEKKTLND